MKKLKIAATALFAVCMILLMYFLMTLAIRKKWEWPSVPVTNTDSIVSDKEISRRLSKYPIFKEVWFDDVKEDTYVIPGLKSTRTLKSDKSRKITACTAMTPQGVCVAGKYLLISAYCSSERHNSVIYVLDLESHEFVKELVLPGKPHVGSIAYDPIHWNIWVTCYEEGRAFVNAFGYDQIKAYNLKKEKQPIVYTFGYPILSQARASFMTIKDGSLYVGYFTKKANKNTSVQRFEIGEDGGLVTDINEDKRTMPLFPSIALPTDVIRISSKCQGMAFSDNYVLLSQSSGLMRSKIRAFEADQIYTDLDARNHKAAFYFTLPSMLEQISTDDDGRLYLLFESAAYAYRSWPVDAIDRVVVLQMSDRKPASADSEIEKALETEFDTEPQTGEFYELGTEESTETGLMEAIWKWIQG